MSKTPLVATAIALSLTFVGPAAGAPEVDQQQLTVNPNGWVSVGGPSEQRIAQIVRAGIPGLLAEVHLPIQCGPNATVLLEIRNEVGPPGSTVLASRTVSGSSLPYQGAAFHPISLPSPPFFPAGERFAIVASASEESECGWFLSPPNTDLYPFGGSFAARPDRDWLFMNGWDMGFKTFVERRCRVPGLIGSALGASDTLLAANGCVRGQVRRVPSKDLPAGQIISQSPAEGTQLPPASSVALVVSSGPLRCTVPRLRGKTLRQARTTLIRANCRLGRVSRRAATRGARRGRVVAQRPAPGARRPAGTRVHVVISR